MCKMCIAEFFELKNLSTKYLWFALALVLTLFICVAIY